MQITKTLTKYLDLDGLIKESKDTANAIEELVQTHKKFVEILHRLENDDFIKACDLRDTVKRIFEKLKCHCRGGDVTVNSGVEKIYNCFFEEFKKINELKESD